MAGKKDLVAGHVAYVRPFAHGGVSGESVAVLTGHLYRYGERLTGDLAGDVQLSLRDYSEQYLTGGDRQRPRKSVAYYVTLGGAHDGRVLAYVTAEGHTVEDLAGAPAWVAEAVRQGLAGAGDVMLRRVTHDCELAPEGWKDGAGCKFFLRERAAGESALEFSDRAAAYDALRAMPRERRRYAWVERVQSL